MAKAETSQAEKKNLPEKAEKKAPKKGSKFLKAIAGIPRRIANAFGNTVAELKKVTWPTRKDLINYTAIVLAFMVMMALVVGFLDLGATGLISLLIHKSA